MIERRRSKIHGWGIFATRSIAKNTTIIDYAGEKVSGEELLRRLRRYIRKGTIVCSRLNRRWVIDASRGGNLSRFINHACRANCYVERASGTIWIRASRNIRCAEELTLNYATRSGTIRCRCRSGCTRWL